MKSNKLFFLLFFILGIFNTCNAFEINEDSTGVDSIYQEYSEIFGVKFKGTEDTLLLKAMNRWIGTPYKYGGKTQEGTDCSGFVYAIHKEVYQLTLNRSSKDMIHNVTVVEEDNKSFGDIVFFKYDTRIGHVGIYLGMQRFIHASTKRGVTINSLDDHFYKTHYYKTGRVKK